MGTSVHAATLQPTVVDGGHNPRRQLSSIPSNCSSTQLEQSRGSKEGSPPEQETAQFFSLFF